MRILREKLLLNNPKHERNFNNKIEKEQIKTAEEINELNLFQLIYLLKHLLEKFKKHAQNLNLTMTTKRSL